MKRLLALALLGCSSPTIKAPVVAVGGGGSSNDEAQRAELLANLQDDILSAYERDEPPDLASGMIDNKVGTARIGAGPGDVYIAGDLARAPSRWPLDVSHQTRTELRSKRLEIHLAADLTAAWMSDEVSWRIEMCKRTATIPLRITALYARDGDRWVPVFEHLSFAQTPAAGEAARAIKSEVSSGDLRDELSGVLQRGLSRHDPSVLALDPSSFVLGPDIADEWHGAAAVDARLPAGRFDDRRVATIGRTPGEATIAYWVGTYLADVPARPGVPAGKVRLRVTHVFEKRPGAPAPVAAAAETSAGDRPASGKPAADRRTDATQADGKPADKPGSGSAAGRSAADKPGSGSAAGPSAADKPGSGSAAGRSAGDKPAGGSAAGPSAAGKPGGSAVGPSAAASAGDKPAADRPADAPADLRPARPRSCAPDPQTKQIPADCHWLLVQTHMSQPITDDELTARVFGTALISAKPLALDCSDGARRALAK